MSELKPCPFCGGEAEILTAESMHGGYLSGIMCNDCRSRGDVYDTEAEAIEAWNTRAVVDITSLLNQDAPPVTYVRERTCRFIDDSGGEFPPKCSACGYEPSIYECSWLGDGGYEFEGNYCPNCGAKVIP